MIPYPTGSKFDRALRTWFMARSVVRGSKPVALTGKRAVK